MKTYYGLIIAIAIGLASLMPSPTPISEDCTEYTSNVFTLDKNIELTIHTTEGDKHLGRIESEIQLLDKVIKEFPKATVTLQPSNVRPTSDNIDNHKSYQLIIDCTDAAIKQMTIQEGVKNLKLIKFTACKSKDKKL